MNVQNCINASNALYNIIQNYIMNTQHLNSLGVFLEPKDEKTFYFHVRFKIPRYGGIYAISISYPPNINGNKDNNISSTIETAIIDGFGDLMYDDNYGYSDTCRFNTPDQIINEILRIVNYN